MLAELDSLVTPLREELRLLTFENGRFLYGAAGARMQKNTERVDDAFSASQGSGLTLRNNEFAYSEGAFMEFHSRERSCRFPKKHEEHEKT